MKLSNGGRRRRLPAARLVLCLILIAAAAGALPAPAQACGHYHPPPYRERALDVIKGEGYSDLYDILNSHRAS